MSRLQELIDELCPDGVEYKELSSIGSLEDYVANGSFASLKQNVTYLTEPDYAVLVRVADYSSGFDRAKFKYVDKHAYEYLKKSILNPGDIIISSVGSVGIVFMCPDLMQPMTLGPNSIVLKSDCSKYLYYYLNSYEGQNQLVGISGQGTLPKINKTQLRRMRVPVPPIEVQREIVRILDSFQELDDALTAEIEAREKQFETYRDELLGKRLEKMCPDGVEYKTLGEIAEIRSGWGFPNKYQGNAEGLYPFYKVKDMNSPGNERYMHQADNYISAETALTLKCKPAPSGSIIFPKIGAAIATEKRRVLTRQSCYDNNVMALIPNKGLAEGYLQFVFSGISLSSFVTGEGAVPSIRKGSVGDYSVPVPPIEVQREIVRILDSFQDHTDSIRAERGTRRKQFEYYRNRLLSFNETEVSR